MQRSKNYNNYPVNKSLDKIIKKRMKRYQRMQGNAPVKQKEHTFGVLIFSKDRAMQLDALLQSFLNCCEDIKDVNINILFKATDQAYKSQYSKLMDQYGEIHFEEEYNFKHQLEAFLFKVEYILFLVDDTIFVKSFNLKEIVELLSRNDDVLGCSLRLGNNITYCYPSGKDQPKPKYQVVNEDIYKYQWVSSDNTIDFGYPLEVSSSIYRSVDMINILSQQGYNNPNTLERVMHKQREKYGVIKPNLLYFETSRAFSIPINIVQKTYESRNSEHYKYEIGELSELFNQGFRIDVTMYKGFIPHACHQEVPLAFKKC